MTTTIRDVLSHKGTQVHTVPPDASVRETVDRMNAHRIGAVLVADSHVRGIFTERDVLVPVVAAGRSPEQTRVSEVMSTELSWVVASDPLRDVIRRMTRERRRHMPVFENERLAGLVSLGDLTAQLMRNLDHQVNDLATYIAGPAVRRTEEEEVVLELTRG